MLCNKILEIDLLLVNWHTFFSIECTIGKLYKVSNLVIISNIDLKNISQPQMNYLKVQV